MAKLKFCPVKIILLIIYLFINNLFVYKYSARSTVNPFAASIIYMAFAILLLIILWRQFEIKISAPNQRKLYFGFVIICVIGLIILMRHFDPNQIHIGRYPALHDWISRLLNGQYPYESTIKTSGLPFLFILAMPFYFLGDLGYFQIFSFLLFSIIIFWRFSDKHGAFKCIVLLLASPIFLFEVAARSELISNMIIVIAFLYILEKTIDKANRTEFILLAIFAGLLLSTRAVVGLILAIYITHIFKNDIKNALLFIFYMLIGFVATLLPFVIWDYSKFIQYSPFAIQASYAPVWLIVIALGASIAIGIFTRRSNGRVLDPPLQASVAIILFAVVAAAFLLTVRNIGWTSAVVGSGFDISYFGFALPFSVIYLSQDNRVGTKITS
jgi:hypothetical protein